MGGSGGKDAGMKARNPFGWVIYLPARKEFACGFSMNVGLALILQAILAMLRQCFIMGDSPGCMQANLKHGEILRSRPPIAHPPTARPAAH